VMLRKNSDDTGPRSISGSSQGTSIPLKRLWSSISAELSAIRLTSSSSSTTRRHSNSYKLAKSSKHKRLGYQVSTNRVVYLTRQMAVNLPLEAKNGKRGRLEKILTSQVLETNN
jgi:hypothetical protein